MLVIGPILLVGCGNEAEWTPGDEDQIRQVIAELSDARSNPEKLVLLFTEGSVPDKSWLTATEQRSFVVEEIDLTGDQATVSVALEDFYGEVVGNQTWQCVRENDQWRISAAPLP